MYLSNFQGNQILVGLVHLKLVSYFYTGSETEGWKHYNSNIIYIHYMDWVGKHWKHIARTKGPQTFVSFSLSLSLR